MKTRVLALNPYHGGSHQAFLDGWAEHSRHDFTRFTLPAYKWKWRMRHAAVTMAEWVAAEIGGGGEWDVVFCTDMLNLAEFLGLSPLLIRRLPTVAYFHENQLTYPVQTPDPRDLHFAFTNLTTALAATAVWFNSAHHRDEFLDALHRWLRRFPDHVPRHAVAAIRDKSLVHPPGIQPVSPAPRSQTGPLRIVWVSRWEHDKAPETFFQALFRLADRGVDFRLSVLGERFENTPEVFDQAKARLADRIEHWGFLPDRAEYRGVLAAADTVVSTARHEFFGIGVLEAVAAGCVPQVPRRLAYPETLGDHPEFYHDGTPEGLAERLLQLALRKARGPLWPAGLDPTELTRRYTWPIVSETMDDAIEQMARTGACGELDESATNCSNLLGPSR